jgi:pimeloyl-ACP methyl ester carboxylesterase
MPLVEINGFTMYYETVGEGPPVLYIHGGLGGMRSVVRSQWDTADAIAGYRFIFYNRRGVGRSDAPCDGYELKTFVDDAIALLDHLGVEQPIVLGTSAGGPIALQLAITAPSRVQALILANTSAHIWDRNSEDAALVLGLLETLATHGPEAAFEQRPEYARHSLEPIWRWPEAEAHGWMDRSRLEEEDLARRSVDFPRDEQIRRHVAELLTCRAYIGVDLSPQLGHVQCPVLLVHGQTDTVIPFTGSLELLEKLPHAELVSVPDAGHMILGRPEAWGAIKSFLDRLRTHTDRIRL